MSGNFKFSLQKILNLRETIEETKAVKLKKSRNILRDEEFKLNELKNSKDTFLNEVQNDLQNDSDISVIDLQVSRSYINQMTQSIEDQNKNVEASEKQVEDDRLEVLQATKDKMILEKLKDRKKEEHVLDSRKKDIKNESEIAIRIQQQNDTRGSE